MKRIIPVFVLLAFSALVQAQTKSPVKQQHQAGFEKFVQEKVAFIVAEMKLPAADSVRFVPVYKELQQEKGKLFVKYSAAGRELRRWHKEHKGEAAPDSLYLRAVRSEAQLNMEDARLEQQYLSRFEKILTPRQLSDYMRAEKKFKGTFMRRDSADSKTPAHRTHEGDRLGKDHVREVAPQPRRLAERHSGLPVPK